MAAISKTILSDAFSSMKSFVIWLKFNKFVPMGQIDNNPTLV